MVSAPAPLADGVEAWAGVPGFIKRNTAWLAMSQMFGGAGTNLIFTLGPLMVVALLGSSALAGVSVAIHSFSRFIAAYPFGRVTDRYGRKVGLLLGLAIAMIGCFLTGLCMSAGSFAGTMLGLLVFSVGMNGIQQLRLAAAEMYPPRYRATIVGLVLSVSIIGVVVTPALLAFGEAMAPGLGLDPLGAPWLLVPVLIVPAMIMISRVQPDPKEIAINLQRYYPSHLLPAAPAARATPAKEGFGARDFFASGQRGLAGLAMFSAQGSMQIAMVTTPLVMVHHGAPLAVVGLSMAIHSAGMFAPSVLMGRLCDRVGRKTVLILGAAIEALGGGITVLSGDHLLITLGILLVGLGWCGINVASTAIVVDSTRETVRGRAVGILDSMGAVAGLAFSLIAGPMAEFVSLGSTGILAMLLMVPPAVLLLRPGALRQSGD